MDAIDGVEVVAFPDAAAFENWLAEHWTRREGVWILVARKNSGIASITEDELVDVGLCYGWISGQRRASDARHYLQKYVPRRPRSVWSQVNVDKVAALSAAGRMREPGLAEVRRAKADGRWDAAYASQKTATVPADLAEAMASNPAAARAFDALDRTARYQLILPVLQARTPTTRLARVQKALDALGGDSA
ncbi:YdeI family protein [Rhodococcus sp. NPDC058505]|uniref:YdeI/OmpD-associated family protein n=1 Tax=Rhodococcus sp. NPDC058505 TaxID=3346531 RepID=UPI0036654AFB